MLIQYEFLKILRRKSTLMVMGASLLITLFLFALPAMQYQTYNKDGVIKGLDGIAYEKAQSKSLSAPLTDEHIQEIIQEYQALFENPDNVGYDGNEKFLIGDAYWRFVAPRTKLLNMIAANYDAPGESSGYNKLPLLNMDDGSAFYATRSEKIERLLNTPSRKLSDPQKAYWRNLNQKVDTPLTYEYYAGWEMIISSFELLMFGLLAICIVLTPVFSGEYQAGTDAVILAGKYGKTKLIRAKIIAALLFGGLGFTLHIVVAWGTSLGAFGLDGWNAPLQIANTTIPYPFTFAQIALLNLGVVYLVLFALIGLTLFLSAKMKSPYLVLAVLVPVLFFPLFLTPNGTTGLYNRTLFLLPYRSTMPEVGKYISYSLGPVVLDALSVRALLYGMLSVVMVPLAYGAFKRHQVSG